MPSYSRDQMVAARIAVHNPSKLHKANRSLLEMSHKDLEEYASGYEPRSLRQVSKASRKMRRR